MQNRQVVMIYTVELDKNVNLNNAIEWNELDKLGKNAGRNCRVESSFNSPHFIADGQLSMSLSLSDITLHKSDCVELTDLATHIVRPSGLSVGILLQGEIRFALDEQVFQLEVKQGQAPICFAFNLRDETQWCRQLIKGNRVQKVIVTLPASWLHSRVNKQTKLDQTLAILANTHARLIEWVIDDATAELSKQVLGQDDNHLSEIEIEQQSLMLLISLLEQLDLQNSIDLAEVQPELSGNMIDTSALRIKNYIEQQVLQINIKSQPSLSAMANDLGYSVSKLQRLFKQNFNASIAEYMRNRRLEIAHKQLQRHDAIGLVAYQAGYNHTSNFTSAFKKYFGYTPGEVV